MSRKGRMPGPRAGLLIGFAVLLVAMVGVFGYIVLSSQTQAREQSENRFGAQAKITAGLTSALLETSVSGSEATAAKTFGGEVISQRALDATAKAPGTLYMFILDQHGKVIATSTGTPPAARTQDTASRTDIREALAGRPSLSDISLPPSHGRPARSQTLILEWAVPFTTPYGQRVEVEALDTPALFLFLNSLLSQTHIKGNGASFMLDSQDRVVGVSGNGTAPGARPKEEGLLKALASKTHGTYAYGGTEYYFASTPIGSSTWRVVLTIKTNRLYSALAGSQSWLLLAVVAAFAVAGIASLLLFRHALRSGVELTTVNAELTSVNAKLEERVAERTAAAEERARELARSNAELEQFSSVASHDLQEPLRKIRMYGDRLRRQLGEDLAEGPGADLERVESAAARMQQLINDLLDFSRVTYRGKEFERVDLGQLTSEVVSDLEARMVELNASVEVSELPVIDADRTQMRQLMQNLIGNALKFHRDDELPRVQISSKIVPGKAPRFFGELGAGDRCVITVQDNGIGFDEKHSERVFTAFERLHSRSSYEGTGIGLSIARKIVWRHGGHITATGTPNEGATFTVTLPLSQSRDQDRTMTNTEGALA